MIEGKKVRQKQIVKGEVERAIIKECVCGGNRFELRTISLCVCEC